MTKKFKALLEEICHEMANNTLNIDGIDISRRVYIGADLQHELVTRGKKWHMSADRLAQYYILKGLLHEQKEIKKSSLEKPYEEE